MSDDDLYRWSSRDCITNNDLDKLKRVIEQEEKLWHWFSSSLAVQTGNLEMVKYVNENCPYWETYAMVFAVREGYYDIVKYIHQMELPTYYYPVFCTIPNTQEGSDLESLLRQGVYWDSDTWSYKRIITSVSSYNWEKHERVLGVWVRKEKEQPNG